MDCRFGQNGFGRQRMIRAFLSHRIDCLAIDAALGVADVYRGILRDLSIEVVSMADSLEVELEGVTDAEIVKKCYDSLASCDIMLFDCTDPRWTYIGCIFEMVYFFNLRRPIIVNVGQTNNGSRPWLRYHATKVVSELSEVRDFCKELVGEKYV